MEVYFYSPLYRHPLTYAVVRLGRSGASLILHKSEFSIHLVNYVCVYRRDYALTFKNLASYI